MLDWLIVGGGLHGSHIAHAISTARPDHDVAVIDPAGALDAWRRRARACGMRFLRSAQAHHLGLRADELRVYARCHGFDAWHALGRSRRPSRALFEAHGAEVVAHVPRIADTVEAIEPRGDSWLVATRWGASDRARRVVLAPGPPPVARPAWGRDITHIFDPAFACGSATGPNTRAHVAVIGGGISAVQYAIARAQAGEPVTLVTRHRLRQTEFDSLPCFAGPRCLTPFLRLPVAERPAALAAARHPGTVPPEIYAELAMHLASGAIHWVLGEITAVADAGLRLADGRRLNAGRIVLATGSDPRPGALFENVADRLQLPLDGHGYAAIDTQLAWAPGLYVTGRPASLQLGPMAPNLRGARLAGARLAGLAVGERQPGCRATLR